MANDNGKRKCVTFWGAVGANLVSGLITGAAMTAITFVAIAAAASRASNQTLQGLRQEGVLPPSPGGG